MEVSEKGINCTYDQFLEYTTTGYLNIPFWFTNCFTAYESYWMAFALSKWRHFKKEGQVGDDEFFYLKQQYIQKCIPKLTPDVQTKVMRSLRDKGVVEVEKRGLPAKNYYRINLNRMIELCWENKGLNYPPPDDPESDEDEDEEDYCGVDNKENKGACAALSKGTSSATNSGSGPAGISGTFYNSKKPNSNEGNSKKEIPSEFMLRHEVPYVENSSHSSIKDSSDKNPLQRKSSLQRRFAQDKLMFEMSLHPPVTNLLPKHPKYKQLKDYPALKPIYDAWASFDLQKHRDGTAIMGNAIKSIQDLRRGVFFNNIEGFEKYHNKSFTVEEILSAIKNFGLAATSPDYEPVGDYKAIMKRKTSLHTFFYNKFSRNGNRSLFIKYLEAPKRAKYSARAVEDKYPQVTRILKDCYVKNASGGVDRLSELEKNDLRRGAIKCADMYNLVKNKLPSCRDLNGFAKLVCNSLEFYIEKYKQENWMAVTTNWFSSDITYNKTVLAYLKWQNMIEEDDEWVFTTDFDPHNPLRNPIRRACAN